ncbi:hypothetical protein KC335_g157 [Hortaea werneckii]|nr:hypothetical protein KC335_g157 [Hortaea werneckii]
MSLFPIAILNALQPQKQLASIGAQLPVTAGRQKKGDCQGLLPDGIRSWILFLVVVSALEIQSGMVGLTLLSTSFRSADRIIQDLARLYDDAAQAPAFHTTHYGIVCQLDQHY